MIRINLLAAEKRAKKKAAAFGVAQRMTLACSIILVVTLVSLGWRYWSLSRESSQLDAEISAAQDETTRLHAIILQVQQFEQRKAQLQQRVVLIEQLRKGQTGPVHMLDQVSRALPPMLWLTELKQADDAVLIDGKSTTLTGLSDFVGNLEASGYFKKSIEIVSSATEELPQPSGELVKFSIKAQFQQPTEAGAAASRTKQGG